jgi:hypothetical protein
MTPSVGKPGVGKRATRYEVAERERELEARRRLQLAERLLEEAREQQFMDALVRMGRAH